MQSEGTFLCLVHVSDGLSMETVTIQWGCRRVLWRWGCRPAKGRSHTHALCPQGVMRNETGVVPAFEVQPLGATQMNLWNAMLSAGLGRGAWRVWREGIPAINHPGWSWDPLLPHGPVTGGGTWGQGYFKGIECPSSAWAGGDGVKGDRLRG